MRHVGVGGFASSCVCRFPFLILIGITPAAAEEEKGLLWKTSCSMCEWWYGRHPITQQHSFFHSWQCREPQYWDRSVQPYGWQCQFHSRNPLLFSSAMTILITFSVCSNCRLRARDTSNQEKSHRKGEKALAIEKCIQIDSVSDSIHLIQKTW